MNKTMQKYFFILITLLAGLGLFSGCKKGENVKVPGVDGPYLSLVRDNIIISGVFKDIVVNGGLRYSVPHYPNSYIEISPDAQSSGTLLSASVSLDDVYGGDFGDLDPQQLPGGRPLPGVTGGSLPAVSFTIEGWNNMRFYIGPDVFGIFFPTKLDLGGAILTSRYHSKDGTRAGNMSLVSNDENDENGGVLLLLDIKTFRKELKSRANRY